jgi:antitoxin FitA
LEPEYKLVATLTIKNIPERLRRRLKESAAEHRRSINGEAISCLEKALAGGRVDPQEFLAQARVLRERLPRIFLTDRDLRAARREGRP